MTTYEPTTETYHILNVIDEDYPVRGALCLDKIATEFYGKTYKGQQTGEMLSNDTVHEFVMDEENVEQYYFDLHDKYEENSHGFYLGMNPWTREPVYTRPGVSQLDYWLSMSWSADKSKVTQEEDDLGWEDNYGAVWAYDFQEYREAPEPRLVLADLIKNGVLPYGKYLLYVGW